MLKNINVLLLVGMLAILYSWQRDNDKLVANFKSLEMDLAETRGEIKAIAVRIKENAEIRQEFVRVERNKKVLNATACERCHATRELALPMYKNAMDVAEAIKVVREGNYATTARSITHKFLDNNSRAKDSITQNELEVRLGILYDLEPLQVNK